MGSRGHDLDLGDGVLERVAVRKKIPPRCLAGFEARRYPAVQKRSK
jgi:hypothetical protein